MGSTGSRAINRHRPGPEFDHDRLAGILYGTLNLPRDASFAVGFSGGVDSTALLLGLSRMQESRAGGGLLALHFNHAIHTDSDLWQEHCERVCHELGVSLVSGRWHHGQVSEVREGAAREARYRWFRRSLPNECLLLLAHHLDDQVETFLLNLLEGRDIHRVAGMLPRRALDFGDRREVIRPLLGFTRTALRTYVESGGMRWVEDPSNRNTGHRRVWIRTGVLPELRRHCPDLDGAVADTARVLQRMVRIRSARARRLLTGIVDPAATRIFCRYAPIPVKGLLSLDAVDREDVLRRWIHAGSLDAPGRQGMKMLLRDLDRVAQIMHESRARSGLRLDWHGASIREYRGRLHLLGSLPEPGEEIPWHGEDIELLPGLSVHSDPKADEGTSLSTYGRLFWRWRRGGERIRLPGRVHSTSLKKACQARGVPGWERDLLPHLACDGGVAWFHGIGWCVPATARPPGCDAPELNPPPVPHRELRLAWSPEMERNPI